jgi:hypothetical protein
MMFLLLGYAMEASLTEKGRWKPLTRPRTPPATATALVYVSATGLRE